MAENLASGSARALATARLRVMSVKRAHAGACNGNGYGVLHPVREKHDAYVIRFHIHRDGKAGKEWLYKVPDGMSMLDLHADIQKKMPALLEAMPDAAERLYTVAHTLRSME